MCAGCIRRYSQGLSLQHIYLMKLVRLGYSHTPAVIATTAEDPYDAYGCHLIGVSEEISRMTDGDNS